MNGAESVVRTLAASGVRVCFANPGTSEMHLVAALDRVPAVRGVLTLFEGVASAAADGYARMTGLPAATLLHLGPGFGNAFANVHNAFKARTPMVNLVGEHAVAHKPLGAPLASDIEAVARPASHWLATVQDARSAATTTAEAVAAARSRGGGVATLVLPADAGWDPSLGPAPCRAGRRPCAGARRRGRGRRPCAAFRRRARGSPARRPDDPRAGPARRGADRRRDGGRRAPRHVPGAARARRGALPAAPLPYLTEFALEALAGLEQLVIAGTRAPVGFFAYPGRPSRLASPETSVTVLARPEEDALAALEALAEALGAPCEPPPPTPVERVALPTGGALDVDALTAVVGALLPDGAIVVDESVTASAVFVARTAGAGEHDYLFLTGGAIGWGLPAATGAAVGARAPGDLARGRRLGDVHDPGALDAARARRST